MAYKYILYKKDLATDTFGVIKYYCDKVELFPIYHNQENVWRVVDGDNIIFVLDTNRKSWAFCKVDTAEASLVKPSDFAYEKYVINFDSAADDAAPISISKNENYNKTNVQIFSTPINVNSASDHKTVSDVHALYVLGSTYIGSNLQPSEITTDNYNSIKGALVVGCGGALIRKDTRIGGALIVDGVVWTNPNSGDVWTDSGRVASEFKYQLHITGTDNSTAANTGALQVLGGGFFAKDLRVSGSINVAGVNTTFINTSGVVTINNVTEVDGITAGSFITKGGVSIAKSAYIGADLTVIGALTTGSLTIQSGLNITGDMSIDNIVTKHDVTFNHNLIFGTSTVGIIFKGNTTYASQPTIMCDTSDTLFIQSVASNGITMLNAIKVKSLIDQPIVTFDSTLEATNGTSAATIFKGGVFISKKLIVNSISVESTDAASISTLGGVHAAQAIISDSTITGSAVKASSSGEVFDLSDVYSVGLKSIFNKPTLSMSVTNATTTIVINSGSVIDDTNKVLIDIPSAITKILTSAWSAGSNSGMLMGSLSIAANMTYHIYAIYNKTTKASDILAVAYHVTDIVLPTGYGYKRYIGSIITDSSNNIIPFTQYGNKFVISPQTEFNDSRTTVPTYVDIQYVARGIKADALLTFKGISAINTTDKTVFSIYNEITSALSSFKEIELSHTASNSVESSEYDIIIPVQNNNAYSRINMVHQNASGSFVLKTKGWIDYNL